MSFKQKIKRASKGFFSKDFWGGKSVLSYTKMGALQDAGRLMEHLDTVAANTVLSKVDSLRIKEDRSVHAQIGTEFNNLKTNLREEMELLQKLSESINIKKDKWNQWYSEISSEAMSHEISASKERLEKVIYALKNGIDILKQLLADRKDYSKLITEEKEKLQDLIQYVKIAKNQFYVQLPKMYKLDKELTQAVDFGQYENALKLSEEKLLVLQESLKDYKNEKKTIRKQVIDAIKSLTEVIEWSVMVTVIPTFNIKTPGLSAYISEMDQMLNIINQFGHKLEYQKNEILQLVLTDDKYKHNLDEIQRRINHIKSA